MEFILLASAHFIALLSPGPDFFLIIRTALRLPKRFGLALCCGIALANGIWVGLALLGVETMRGFHLVLGGLRYLGSAYLLYLGFLLLTSAPAEHDNRSQEVVEFEHHWLAQFRVGFLSAILNPKNMIFYLALFTSMVSPETIFVHRLFYGIWMIMVVFLWDGFIVLMTGRYGQRSLSHGWTTFLEKSAGVALVGFGLFLPFT